MCGRVPANELHHTIAAHDAALSAEARPTLWARDDGEAMRKAIANETNCEHSYYQPMYNRSWISVVY